MRRLLTVRLLEMRKLNSQSIVCVCVLRALAHHMHTPFMQQVRAVSKEAVHELY